MRCRLDMEKIALAGWLLIASITLVFTVYSNPDYFWANPTMSVASIIWIALSVLPLLFGAAILVWMCRFGLFIQKHLFKRNDQHVE